MAKVKFLKNHPKKNPHFKPGQLALIDNAAAHKLEADGILEILPDQKTGLRAQHELMRKKAAQIEEMPTENIKWPDDPAVDSADNG